MHNYNLISSRFNYIRKLFTWRIFSIFRGVYLLKSPFKVKLCCVKATTAWKEYLIQFLSTFLKSPHLKITEVGKALQDYWVSEWSELWVPHPDIPWTPAGMGIPNLPRLGKPRMNSISEDGMGHLHWAHTGIQDSLKWHCWAHPKSCPWPGICCQGSPKSWDVEGAGVRPQSRGWDAHLEGMAMNHQSTKANRLPTYQGIVDKKTEQVFLLWAGKAPGHCSTFGGIFLSLELTKRKIIKISLIAILKAIKSQGKRLQNENGFVGSQKSLLTRQNFVI